VNNNKSKISAGFNFRSMLLVVFITGASLISGCISLAPTPGFARAGDVINASLGGIKRNADGQLILTTDLTVTITDSNSITHTPKILGTYRAFPDHTSQYAVSAQDRSDTNFGDLYPHDGSIWVTIRLTDAGNVPLPLATGPATLSITSSKLTQTFKVNEGVYTSLPIEILPGTGTPSLTDSQNLAYQTEGFLSVEPSVVPTTTVGGVQIEIIFDASVTSSDPIELRVVPQHHDPNSGLIQSVTDNGDGTKTLRAFLTNPNGFVAVNSWSQGQSTLKDLSLAIVSKNGSVAYTPNANLSSVYTVTGNSFYVDLNGNVISGIVPQLSNQFF